LWLKITGAVLKSAGLFFRGLGLGFIKGVVLVSLIFLVVTFSIVICFLLHKDATDSAAPVQISA
jgi:hypothetical protein